MKTDQPISVSPSAPIAPVDFDPTLDNGVNWSQLLATLRRKALIVVGVTTLATLAAGIKAMTDAPRYASTLEILAQPVSAESAVVSSIQPDSSTPPAADTLTPADLLQILTSSKVLMPVFEKFTAQYPEVCAQLILPPAPSPNSISPRPLGNNPCYEAIVQNLSVELLETGSKIIQVTYEGSDPAQVQAFLDLVSQAYLDYSLESRQSDIRRAIEFVNAKLPDLRKQVENLQEQKQLLRLQNDLIDPASQGEQLTAQVNTFTEQLIQSEVDISQVQALYDDLRSQLARGAGGALGSSPAMRENARYQALLAQLSELDGRIAAASAVFVSTAPDMQVLLDQRRTVLNLLEQESQEAQRGIITQIRQLEAREATLRSKVAELKSGVRQLSGVSRRFTDIERELAISTDTLSQFLAKQQTLQIESAQREIPWEVLTPATVAQTVAASFPTYLFMGAALGLIAGVAAALLVDRATDVIYTAEEMKRITGLPLLGAIPFHEPLKGTETSRTLPIGTVARSEDLDWNTMATQPAKAAAFFESFRSLYANIRLLNSDTKVRSIVISSTIAGEGKSVVAAYLAQAAAAMGQRVMLVDTDLRHSGLHRLLGLQNEQGLVDLISGDVAFKDAVQRSPVEPNLYVLTTGSIPPDPTRLLSSQRMQYFMEKIQDSFDFVIYDSSALLSYADGYLLADYTDGMILVTETGKLKRTQLEQALERIRVSSTTVLGTVLQKGRD